jgi:hypothetical protein
MSALPPKADIAGRQLDVRFVPFAEVVSLGWGSVHLVIIAAIPWSRLRYGR